MPTIIFSELTADELPLLQKIGEQCFRETYQHLNDPDEFEPYIKAAFSLDRLRAEWESSDSHFNLAWEEGGDCVGYFKLNRNKASKDLPALESVELERIYLTKSHWGKGLGAYLIRQAVSLAQKGPYQWLWLGVWKKNPRAIRFYQKHGFEIFGEHDFVIGKDRQRDYLMRLNLE